jgi:hypothetical protein
MMKTSLILSVLTVLAFQYVSAQEAARPGETKGTFFQRFFGPDAPAQKAGVAQMYGPSQPAEATWPLFPRGKFPAGPTVRAADLGTLPTGSYASQTTYLIGDFVVTAAGSKRAVLREASNEKSPLRLIAEYSEGNPAPAEQTKLTLNEADGLLIREIKKGPDGHLNVQVRVIAAP